MQFNERYNQLNDAQRAAVDTIDGPVMVVAGPGTGKTELLAMRTANILDKTDVLPENILCLTFTESGSVAMQKRLTEIVGRSAYNVSVFTFHAFGTHIMSKYREHFYNGATFRPADDLARHRIVTEILDRLDYDNPLRATMNGRYTSTSDIIASMSDLKRAGLTDAEFTKLLESAQHTCDVANVLLAEVFTPRISKTTLESLEHILPKIESIQEDQTIPGLISLRDVIVTSLREAIDAAHAHDKTTPPLTAWKKAWMTTDTDKSQVLKTKKSLPKLRALAYVYGLYLQIMNEAELIDYDDMIMQLVHAMEVNDDLRLDLQERYQYIMVDEFQDTNLAQMRILRNLTDNPVFEGRPNILVVGDDDQAIYGFQGAEVGNILQFKDLYPEVSLITLIENYRSTQDILTGARRVIIQGTERLENRLSGLDKSLVAKSKRDRSTAEIVSFASPHDERKWIAKKIQELISSDVVASEIAVIARKHSDLVSLLSYLSEKNIPVSYDRRDNVLNDEVVGQIEHVGRIIHAISTGMHDEADELLPMLISHPAWGIKPETVWEISLAAHKNHELWFETMRLHDASKPLFDWLVDAAQQALHLPLERMLDIILGNAPAGAQISPLKEFFFSDKVLADDPTSYTRHLENLSAIRTRLREHSIDMTAPKLADFLDFVRECHETDTRITSYRHIGEDSSSVRLLTAHGSKGLEFDNVFVINATDAMWGEGAVGKASSISFPPHLRLRQNTNDYNERLRLFYVAMTRARQSLYLTHADENDNTKQVLPASFLIGSTFLDKRIESDGSAGARQEEAEHLWYAPVINIPQVSMEQYLAPLLKDYRLSATHINAFIDVTEGGPRKFLLNSLLRFPRGYSPASSYGIAIHAALQRAHDHMRVNGSLLPEEDILHEFEKQLSRMPFTEDEAKRYSHKGSDALRAFLKQHYQSFNQNQQAEVNFRHQDVRFEEARLTGALDMVQFDKDLRTASVTDYKTGAALTSWDKGQDYQKVKAHKYRQQLLFYKLLIENSRDYRDYQMTEGILQFVEPDKSGAIINLRITDFEAEEFDRFKRLVSSVWSRIIARDFPDTSKYEQTIAGIRQFEDDLLT